MTGKSPNAPRNGRQPDDLQAYVQGNSADSGFFEECEHTADVAIHCGGPDLESLFRNAALGMYHLMGVETAPGGKGTQQSIRLEALDVESLLVDWLGELAYFAETGGLVFKEMFFKILSASQLEATVIASPAARLEKTIKAVTYHDLKVEKQEGGYTTTVVFDV